MKRLEKHDSFQKIFKIKISNSRSQSKNKENILSKSVDKGGKTPKKSSKNLPFKILFEKIQQREEIEKEKRRAKFLEFNQKLVENANMFKNLFKNDGIIQQQFIQLADRTEKGFKALFSARNMPFIVPIIAKNKKKRILF